jgi:hypothetical protein
MKQRIFYTKLFFYAIALGAIYSCHRPDLPNPSAKNSDPIANASINQIITPFVDSIVLDGSLSYDPDGNSTLKYSWRIIKSSINTIIRNPNHARTIAAQLSPGYHEFELTVTDQFGWGSKDSVLFFVGNNSALTLSTTDTTISLPYSRAWLNGSVNEYERLESAEWKVIEKPAQATVIIRYPTSLETAAIDLYVPGEYKFELTVKSKFREVVNDTMTVSVLSDTNIYTSEIVFENLAWVCPWQCNSDLNNIPSIGNRFKIYLKTNNITDWEIAVPDSLDFNYGIYDNWFTKVNNTIAFSTYRNVSSASKIKIVY